MPLTRISIRRGRDPADKAALMDGGNAATREALPSPEDHRFIVIDEHDADSFVDGRDDPGIAGSDDLEVIEITITDTHAPTQKQAPCPAVADAPAAKPGMRPQDVLVVLTEVKSENWSFGEGVARYQERS